MKFSAVWFVLLLRLPALAQSHDQLVEHEARDCSQVFVSAGYVPGGTDLPEVGMRAMLVKKLTVEQINLFAVVSGDYNKVHIDRDFAERNGHRDVLAHGMLVASFVSNLAGNYLPGSGCKVLNFNAKARGAAYPGDELSVSLEVKTVSSSRRLVTLETIVRNQDEQVVLKGDMTLVYSNSDAG